MKLLFNVVLAELRKVRVACSIRLRWESIWLNPSLCLFWRHLSFCVTGSDTNRSIVRLMLQKNLLLFVFLKEQMKLLSRHFMIWIFETQTGPMSFERNIFWNLFYPASLMAVILKIGDKHPTIWYAICAFLGVCSLHWSIFLWQSYFIRKWKRQRHGICFK